MITTLLQDQLFLAAGCVLFVALFLLLWLLRQLWHHEDSIAAHEDLIEQDPDSHEEIIADNDHLVDDVPLHDTPSPAVSVSSDTSRGTALEKRLDEIVERLNAIERQFTAVSAAITTEKEPALKAQDLERFIQRFDARVELLAGDDAVKEDLLEKLELKIDAIIAKINRTSHE